MDEFKESISKQSECIRDHWVTEAFALDLLNGEDEATAASEIALTDHLLIFDKDKN